MKPTIRDFVRKQLTKNEVMSDVDLMDLYAKKYYIDTGFFKKKDVNYGMLGKRLESFRKMLWVLKKRGMLQEVNRVKTPMNPFGKLVTETHEIFFKLR